MCSVRASYVGGRRGGVVVEGTQKEEGGEEGKGEGGRGGHERKEVAMEGEGRSRERCERSSPRCSWRCRRRKVTVDRLFTDLCPLAPFGRVIVHGYNRIRLGEDVLVQQVSAADGEGYLGRGLTGPTYGNGHLATVTDYE